MPPSTSESPRPRSLSVDDAHTASSSTTTTTPNARDPLSPLSPRALLNRAARQEALDRLRFLIGKQMERNRQRGATVRGRLRARSAVIYETAQATQQRVRAQSVQVAEKVRGVVIENKDKVEERLREERRISAAQYYLLTAATLLLVIIVGSYLILESLKLLARIETVWWFTRQSKLDDFRKWAQEVCIEPWHRETVLCQAVDGNWLARQLVRAKLHESDADHCDPNVHVGGCRHEPCGSKGLSSVLLGVADSWGSPLNNRFSAVYYALLPIRGRLKVLLRGLARGKLPLSKLDKELQSFPLLQRHVPFLGMKRESTTKEWLFREHVYPIIREWGVVIGGEKSRPPKPGECPPTLEELLSKDPTGPLRQSVFSVYEEASGMLTRMRDGLATMVQASADAAVDILRGPRLEGAEYEVYSGFE